MRREQRAASAEGDNDRLEALGEEGLRRGGDFGLGLDWQPGEDGELSLVGANKLASRARSISSSQTARAGLSTVLTPCRLPKASAA